MSPDPDEAEARDRASLDGTAAPPPDVPHLTNGLIDRDGDGGPTPTAGLLSPHGSVRAGGRTGRFDDILGVGFTLLLRGAPAPWLLATLHVANTTGLLDGRVAHFGAEGEAIVDLEGRFEAFMDRHQMAAMLVRPDFYLFESVRR